MGRRALYVAVFSSCIAAAAFIFARDAPLTAAAFFICFLVVVIAQGVFFYSRWLKWSARRTKKDDAQ